MYLFVPFATVAKWYSNRIQYLMMCLRISRNWKIHVYIMGLNHGRVTRKQFSFSWWHNFNNPYANLNGCLDEVYSWNEDVVKDITIIRKIRGYDTFYKGKTKQKDFSFSTIIFRTIRYISMSNNRRNMQLLKFSLLLRLSYNSWFYNDPCIPSLSLQTIFHFKYVYVSYIL